ncbi:hypothetical protein [Caldanaerobacter subterraneus]|uniref:hypothetical protein n=1 Tax=Caldanaerobacter subterraneus TaxID=911092 RepID=UPI001F0E2C29|nr:hypothetical protein [Caldanaerobacter subterraneus]
MEYLKELDREYLQVLYERYKGDEKVNEIRFRVCEMILNGDYVDEKNLDVNSGLKLTHFQRF